MLEVWLPTLFESGDEAPSHGGERDQAIKSLVALLDGVGVDTLLGLTTLGEVGLSLKKTSNPSVN